MNTQAILDVNGQQYRSRGNTITADGLVRCRDALIDSTKAIGAGMGVYNGTPSIANRIGGNLAQPDAATNTTRSVIYKLEHSLTGTLTTASAFHLCDPSDLTKPLFSAARASWSPELPASFASGDTLKLQWNLTPELVNIAAEDLPFDSMNDSQAGRYNGSLRQIANRICGRATATAAGRIEIWRSTADGMLPPGETGEQEDFVVNAVLRPPVIGPHNFAANGAAGLQLSFVYPKVEGSVVTRNVWAVLLLGTTCVVALHKDISGTERTATQNLNWGFDLSSA